MVHDYAQDMKTRMRADLKAAMKEGRANDAKVIRALIAAIDNAEAPPLPTGRRATDQHRFQEGSAEIERLVLGATQVQAVLLEDIREREHAADDMERLGRPEQAQVLRAEAALARRYIA
jgi:uncharacterized protein YqeY